MTERNSHPGHAFISYVREDATAVDQLQRALESAGIKVWRDTASLWPGQNWRTKIRQAITSNALVFIACFSRNSLARQVGYQYEELNLAIEQMRQRSPDVPWLIPVRLSECDIPDLDIGGGHTLGSIQRADLFGDHREEGTARVVEIALQLLHQNEQWPPGSDTTQGPAASGTRNSPEPGRQSELGKPFWRGGPVGPGDDLARRVTPQKIQEVIGGDLEPPTEANGPIGKIETNPLERSRTGGSESPS